MIQIHVVAMENKTFVDDKHDDLPNLSGDNMIPYGNQGQTNHPHVLPATVETSSFSRTLVGG